MAVANPPHEVPAADYGPALDAARGSLEHQFQIAERLDAKARGQMTLAGAWFAVTQGVAGVVLGQDLALGWKLAVLGTAVVAATSLVFAFYRHYQVWKLRDQPDLNPDAIRAFERDVGDATVNAAGTILEYYAEMLGDRQKVNTARGERFAEAVPSWFAALALTAIELLTVVVATVLG